MKFGTQSASQQTSHLFQDPTAILSQKLSNSNSSITPIQKQHPLLTTIADWQQIDIGSVNIVCEDNTKGYYQDGIFNPIYSEYFKFYLSTLDNHIWGFKINPTDNQDNIKVEPFAICPNLRLNFQNPDTRITFIKRIMLNPDSTKPNLGNDVLIVGFSDSSLNVLDPITLQPIHYLKGNFPSATNIIHIEVIGHYLLCCGEGYNLKIINWWNDWTCLKVLRSDQFSNSGILLKKQVDEEEDTLAFKLPSPSDSTSKFHSIVITRFGTLEIRRFNSIDTLSLRFDIVLTAYLKDFVPIGGFPLNCDENQQNFSNSTYKLCLWSNKYLVIVIYTIKTNSIVISEYIPLPKDIKLDSWNRIILFQDSKLIASTKMGRIYPFTPGDKSQIKWNLDENGIISTSNNKKGQIFSLPFFSQDKLIIFQASQINSKKFHADLLNFGKDFKLIKSSELVFPYIESHPYFFETQSKQKTLQISLNVSQLARGHNDGTILLIPLPHIFTPSNNLLPFASPGSEIVLLDSGQRAPITYLLDPISTMSTQFKNHLIAGTADGSVHIWEVNSYALLFSSTSHQSPIVKLFQIPIIPNSLLNDTVFCLAKDNSLSIISLKRMSSLGMIPGNRSQLKTLQWSSDSNTLIITYTDDSKLLWTFPNGQLTIYENSSQNIEWDCGVNLNDTPIPDWSALGLHHTITSFPIYSYPSPIPIMQIHIINIKRLLSDLHHGNAPSITLINGVEFIYSVHETRFESNYTPNNQNHSRSASTQDFPSQPISGLSHRLAHTILSSLLHPEELKSIGKGCYDYSSSFPNSMLSLGIRGRSTNGFGIPTSPLAPSEDHYFGWKISSIVSATRLLPILTLAKPVLSTKSKPESSWIELTTSYGTLLGDRVSSKYQPSSLYYLSKFWPDLSPEISQATRVGFISSFGQYSLDQQKDIIQYWGIRLSPTNYCPKTLTEIRACLVLAIIGSEHDIIDPYLCPRIARSLTYLLSESMGAELRMMAIDLMSKGFDTWEKYVDPSAVLYPLFRSVQVWGDSVSGSAKTIYQAILNICIASPTLFASTASLALNGQVAFDNNTEIGVSNDSPRSGVLKALCHVIRNRPTLLIPFISPFLESVVKVLDPKDSILRKTLIQDATLLLFDTVETYSFVDFHKPSQRLAVGTLEGAVVIYDVRTSTRYQVFEGHIGQITGVAISPDGKFIASYSTTDQTLNIWQQSSGFFDLITRSFRSPSPSPAASPSLHHLFRRSLNYSHSAPGSGRTSPESTLHTSTTPQPDLIASRLKASLQGSHSQNPHPHNSSSTPYRSFQLGTASPTTPSSCTDWERIHWISDRELILKKQDVPSSAFQNHDKNNLGGPIAIQLTSPGGTNIVENTDLNPNSNDDINELRFKI